MTGLVTWLCINKNQTKNVKVVKPSDFLQKNIKGGLKGHF
jgi:hypothetical protein